MVSHPKWSAIGPLPFLDDCNCVLDFRITHWHGVVELSGIEPLTSSLRTRRSPN